MFGLFHKIGEMKLVGKEALEFRDVEFNRNFGPFKEGEKATRIRVNFKPPTIEEVGDDDRSIRSHEFKLITANNLLEQVIAWMDDDTNPETLFTKDGRKAYRFYEGTLIDQFLRSLHDEVKKKP